MIVEYDGVPVNKCPLCGNQMGEHDDTCVACREAIWGEMYALKTSFNDSYEFVLAVTEWLESQ